MTCALATNSLRLVLAGLAMLAAGCCLPELSGRCEPASAACVTQPRAADKREWAADHEHREGPAADHHGIRHRLNGFGHRLGVWQGPGTPPGEVVPLPRFHPVPTRPVFEPLPEYSLPASLVRPLAPVIPAREGQLGKQPEVELLPTPAQPVPEAQ